MDRWQSTPAPPSGRGGGVPCGVDEAVVPYDVGAALQDGREGGVAGDEAGRLEVRRQHLRGAPSLPSLGSLDRSLDKK